MEDQPSNPVDSKTKATPSKNLKEKLSASPATSTLAAVPDTWPGAFGAYKYSKQAVMLNITTLIFLFLISILFSFIKIVPLIGFVVSLILSVFISTAYYITYLAGVNGKKIDVGSAMSDAVNHLLKMICVIILTGMAVGLGFL